MIKKKLVQIIFLILKPISKMINFYFDYQLANSERYQTKILKKIVKNYKNTIYFSKYWQNKHFSIKEFQHSIPIVQYESIKADILEDYPRYKKNLLPSNWVKVEYTSGSGGKKKLIPYTQMALKDFQHAFTYWICDTLSHFKIFKTGKTFYSISPSTSENSPQDDKDYLSPLTYYFLKDYIINRAEFSKIKDFDSFQLVLAINLLQHEDLEILFLWSPSYLTSIFSTLLQKREMIFQIMETNQFIVNGEKIDFFFSKARIQYIKKHFPEFNLIWPNLKFLSCWTQGSASLFIPEIRSHFPHLIIQEKGLIATEAVFTIPINKANGCVPLVKHYFYEFLDSDNNVYLLAQLELGKIYSILISNLSGLLRYEIEDMVQVISLYKNTPVLSFVSKKYFETNLTGEKLNEMLIKQCLEKLLKPGELAFMFPSMEDGPHYKCMTDAKDSEFQNKLEKNLSDIFHYQESRRLGQLKEVDLIRVSDCKSTYIDYFLSLGMNYGDIKFHCLLKEFQFTKS